MVTPPQKPSSEQLLLAIFQELRSRGLHVPGLFRHPVSVTDTRRLHQDVYTEGLKKIKEQEDPHQIAALVLWHLRHLQEPLIPSVVYDLVVEMGKSAEDPNGSNAGDNIWANQGMEGGSNWSMGGNGEPFGPDLGGIDLDQLRNLVSQIPQEQWVLLSLLLEFLSQVISTNGGNDATLSALAQVFAPVLCRPPGSAYMSLRHVKDLVQIQRVVFSLMANYALLMQKDSMGARPGTERLVHTPLRDRDNEKLARQRRKSNADLAIVQKLITESVSLLFAAPNDGESDKKAESGSPEVIRLGAGKPSNMFLRLPSAAAFGSNNSGRRSSFFDDDDDDITGHLTYGESMNLMSPIGSLHLGTKTGISVSKDRRRMQQACKALRAQIHQFEEVFVTENGHLPRGRERAVLSSTYAQLKQWKRMINIDAAIQIQAFFRGYRVRKKYPKVPRLLQQYIPLPNSRVTASSSRPALPASGRSASENQSILEARLAALADDKKQIKTKLKEYDLMFLEKEGRMPNKADKEPMRALYDRYNALKITIKEVEEAISNSIANPSRLPSSRNRHPPQTPPPPAALISPAITSEHPYINADAGSQNKILPPDPFVLGNVSVEQLKKDKRELHIMLKAYEQDFKNKYGREVSSPSDIAPVEAEYQRYKEIKKKLSKG